MIETLRQAFNASFSQATHDAMVDAIAAEFGHRPPFRIAETPVFLPPELIGHLTKACSEIVDTLVRPDFATRSQAAVPSDWQVPNETPHTTFLQMDFGLCQDEEGHITPQLIEAQGFPSLYCFQDVVAHAYQRFFKLPEEFTHLFGGLTAEEYRQMIKDILLGDCDPEQVILLEIQPAKQVTAIDFFVVRKWFGIEMVCVSEIIKRGRSLFYKKDGREIKIERIYNRVIFDELAQRQDLDMQFSFTDDLDVHWVGHPNWFFRISKHSLPMIKSQYAPESHFVSELASIPDDLEHYVLKPLFSFAGSGVILHPTAEDIARLEHPDQFILQRKVHYAPVIPTPDVPAKAEVRMMMLWPDKAERPTLVNNLIRLSKGEMVGVRYNKDKTWVGGSVGFFKP